jgi:Spy/CpxP family protein refolding chaperone
MTTPFPNYRFILTAGLLMALFAALAEAQTRPAREGREAGPPQLRGLQERISQLNLSDDQKVQFQAIKDEIAETIKGLGKGVKDLPPAERREKLQAALGDVREKFMSILTPEQKQQFAAQARNGQRPLAQEQPGEMATTRPAEAKVPGKRAAAGGEPPMLARLRENVEALDLTPDQKTKVDAIFKDAADKARELRKEAAGQENRGAMRDKVQELTQGLREKLAGVLTPEQREKLRENLPAREGRRLGDGQREGQRKGADPPATKPSDANANHSTPDAAAAKAAAGSLPADVIAVGSPAPAFTLSRLNGSELSSKSLLGKPTVLAFGSLSSPSFRDRLPKLEQLKNKYRSRANVIVVYTKEAHPADGWQVERNRDDKVDITAPTTTKDRIALATKLRDLSKTSLDIAVDDIDDPTLHAFGDKINGAIVLSPTGLIAGVQTYCDPSGLGRMIDESFKVKGPQMDADEHR